MNWQTVAIPFAAGIKPTSRGRVLDQTKLLTAQNCFFNLDEGPEKRHGHSIRALRASAAIVALDGIVPPTAPAYRTPHTLGNPALSEYWLHGYGLFDGTEEVAPGTYGVSAQPLLGYAFGSAQRDNENLAWDGFRLLSTPSADGPSALASGQGVMPSLRGEPIAKSLNGQLCPDAADNGVLRSVVWTHSAATKSAYRSVYNAQTGACIVSEEAFANLTAPEAARVFTMGPWTHVLVQDDETELFMRSWHNDTPGTVVARTLGPVSVNCFDVRKYSETKAVVARINGGDILVTVLGQNGSTTAAYTPDIGASTGLVYNVSVAVHHEGLLGILWQTTANGNILKCYELNSGVVASDTYGIYTSTDDGRIALCDTYLKKEGCTVWSVFIDDKTTSTYRKVLHYSVVTRVAAGLGDIVLRHTRQNVAIASQAFRVGQRPYLWLTGTPTIFTLQPTWFLCDEGLLPVGKALFGLAYVNDPETTLAMPGVNWHTSDAATPAKDRVVFTGALGYRQRADVASESAVPNGVWLEPSIFFYSLDFLAAPRSAQAGRSTYFSGAQLWEYDGANLNEAGFHLAPEGYTVADGGSGNLDETKEYNWRIDLCYKNAQNEEVRSWSKIVAVAADAFGASTFKATITVPHVPMTRRAGAYFLVFRTEGNGTEFYLVSSRNPADAGASENNFLANSRASATYTFTDNLADTALIAREYHPANAPNYLQPLPAPACEVVAAGRDRLWLAGGEMSLGEIAPSRYFQPGETPSFTPGLGVQIDRNSEPITAIGFVGEQAVFFRKTSAYTLDSEGPDNLAQGVWGFPRLALADVGAVSQEGLALAGEGLYFQSPAGIRVITQGGGLRPPGAGLLGGLGTDVDTLAASGNYAAAVVVPMFSQIRWYSRDSGPTLVVDYTKNAFTTFTGLECAGAGYRAAGDTVVLVRGDAEVWTEVDGTYLDGDRTYETILKTAWLHGGALGDFQRARRWALFGDADTGLTLRYRVFYDERPFHAEEGLIEFNGNANDSVWGDNDWGDGSWGDSNNPDGQSGLWFRDGVFRLRRRFARQKCSVFAIEFSDMSGTADFAPSSLAIELGSKQGLDRIP